LAYGDCASELRDIESEIDRDMKKDKETWRNIGQIDDEYAEDILWL
jgi:hypothetical protein